MSRHKKLVSGGRGTRARQRPPKMRRRTRPFPVVGVGASAGGLEAFLQLVKHLPPDTGMAFVLVQHLAPQHESALAGLVSRTARMPVAEVREGMRVEPNRIYVIPPNVNMALSNGVLRLSRRPEGQHTSIDFFFNSLAHDRKSGACGVILSGTGSDGTKGLQAIKAEGGITFAQDAASAKFREMPGNALTSGCIDFVMSPEGIARQLAAFGRHPYLAAKTEREAEVVPASEDSLHKVFAVAQKATGVDFSHYRETTVKRRIQRRMVVLKIERLADYVKYLEEHSPEAAALCQDILTSVTTFFHEPEFCDVLKRQVLPKILKNRNPDALIRVWVPGCSTGEEAYSVAICLLEHLEEKAKTVRLQLFATDVNEAAVQKARAGSYPESLAADVSPPRLRHFFAKAEHGYQVAKKVRSLCVFAKHDLTRDPPFSNLDLISCRNALAYLKPILQKRIIPVFHYALKPDGFLVLGSAENLGPFPELFSALDRKNRVYVKKPRAAHLALGLVGAELVGAKPKAAEPRFQQGPGGSDLEREAQRILLSRYAPAAVIVDTDLRVCHFIGRTGAYLEPASGEASLNLLRMVREGVAFDLRALVQEAKQKGRPVRQEQRRIKLDGGLREVNLEVIPLPGTSTEERFFMVVFEPARNAGAAPDHPGGKTASKKAHGHAASRNGKTGPLRRELDKTKKYLQKVIEGQEAANEELRAANEEILSSNEEFQSTNEELETAKEELQSTNEELITLNEELQNRNADLSVANSDLVNLLGSVNIPVVILDNECRIRRFTPAAERVFNIIPTDVGRRISDLRHTLDVHNLRGMIAEVVDSVTAREVEVRNGEGRWYSLRIRPYKTTDNRIAGAVLALVDIHGLKSSIQHQRRLLELVPDSMVLLDLDLKIALWNKGSESLYGYTQEEAQGKDLSLLLKAVFPKPKEYVVAEFLKQGRWEGEVTHTTKDGRPLTVLSSWTLLRDEEGQPSAAAQINHDITQGRQKESRLLESERRYRRFFDHDLAGVYRATLEGRILDCNQAFAQLFGAASPDGVVGSLAQDLGFEPSEWRAFLGRVEKTTKVAGDEISFVRKDGTRARARMSAILVQEGEAEPGVIEGFILDVTTQKQAEDSLRALARRSVQLQDEERQRFGRQLHDRVGSTLVALNMNLSAAQGTAAALDSPARDALSESLSMGKEALNEVRTLSYLLHPPLMHDLGTSVALRWYVEGFAERSGIKVQLDVPEEVGQLPAELEGTVFRVLQESLSNIHLHSGSETARIKVMRSPEDIRIEVSDAGHGFAPASVAGAAARPGLGIVLMRERVQLAGGSLEVDSRPGKGTTIRAVLPVGRSNP